MQAVEEKFHLSGEYSTFEDFRSSSKEASRRFSTPSSRERARGKEKKERKERGGENEGTKISAGRNFYSTRKLVEWKSFPFGCLNGLPFVNC